jgi:UDP-N-acetyl-D-mannosaminuronic acid dehydrogenase
MNSVSSVLEKVRLKKANVAVLGLGHVGLPTALIFARAGFKVTGVDSDVRKVEALRQGTCYIREPGLQGLLTACLKSGTFEIVSNPSDAIRRSDFVSTCVPTPVKNAKPDLTYFETAINSVMACAHERMTVLIESTLPPSTTLKFVLPELQHTGYRVDEEIFLAYCPERLAPGHALEEYVNNARIVGGIGPRSSEIAAEFFKTVCKNIVVTDALTAEIAKVAENTFRDLNIAYANLLALIAERLGGDVIKVIDAANTHPRVTIHRPGLGVGGPCLPKDPYLLVHGLPEDLGQLVTCGRKLNDHMPGRIIDLLTRALLAKGISLENAKISVLGVAYKADTEDVTNSPVKTIVEELLKKKAFVTTFDPYSSETFGGERAVSIEQALRDADCVIVAAAHTDFKSMDLSLLRQLAKPHCVIFDGSRLLDATRVRGLGLTYLGTGYGCGNYGKSF